MEGAKEADASRNGLGNKAELAYDLLPAFAGDTFEVGQFGEDGREREFPMGREL